MCRGSVISWAVTSIYGTSLVDRHIAMNNVHYGESAPPLPPTTSTAQHGPRTCGVADLLEYVLAANVGR